MPPVYARRQAHQHTNTEVEKVSETVFVCVREGVGGSDCAHNAVGWDGSRRERVAPGTFAYARSDEPGTAPATGGRWRGSVAPASPPLGCQCHLALPGSAAVNLPQPMSEWSPGTRGLTSHVLDFHAPTLISTIKTPISVMVVASRAHLQPRTSTSGGEHLCQCGHNMNQFSVYFKHEVTSRTRPPRNAKPRRIFHV